MTDGMSAQAPVLQGRAARLAMVVGRLFDADDATIKAVEELLAHAVEQRKQDPDVGVAEVSNVSVQHVDELGLGGRQR